MLIKKLFIYSELDPFILPVINLTQFLSIFSKSKYRSIFQVNDTCTSSCVTQRHCSTWLTGSILKQTGPRGRSRDRKPLLGLPTRTCSRCTGRRGATPTCSSTQGPRKTAREATTSLRISGWAATSSTRTRAPAPAICRCCRASPPKPSTLNKRGIRSPHPRMTTSGACTETVPSYKSPTLGRDLRGSSAMSPRQRAARSSTPPSPSRLSSTTPPNSTRLTSVSVSEVVFAECPLSCTFLVIHVYI